MVTKSVTMKFREAKKHSYIYEATEPAADTPVRTVYVMKAGLPATPPELITLSLSFAE